MSNQLGTYDIQRNTYSGQTILLMRHGRTDSSGPERYIGRTDIPLNAAGREQARQWAGRFSESPPARIISSNLTRSIEMARIIASACGTPTEEIAAFSEIDLGQWEGRTFEEIRTSHPAEFAERGKYLAGYRPPGGESFGDLQGRCLPAFNELVEQTQGDLLIVGHAGVNRVLLCHILGMPLSRLFRLAQAYGCLNILTRRRGEWFLTGLNLTPETIDIV
jgi:alpha-ribazole phosphatase